MADTGGSRGPSIQELPSDFVIRTFLLIADVRDVLSLQATCKRFCALGRSRLVWRPRLESDLGIRLEHRVEGNELSLQRLYCKAVTGGTDLVRFWGVMTDGGCDNDWLHYWVDNLFVPNHWESFCSAGGRNVHCFGLLLGEELEQDRRSAADREYMIRKCRYPAARLFNEHFNRRSIDNAYSLLQCWSTPELEHFVIALYHDLQNGGPLGALLEMGLQGQELQRERVRMRELIRRLEHQATVNARGIISREGKPRNVGKSGNEGKSKNGLVLYDSLCTNVLQRMERQIVGIVDRLMVSRRGSFSCPVSSGAIFMGNLTDCHQFKTHDDVVDCLQQMTYTPYCTALNNLTDRESVRLESEIGHLPPILATHSTLAGEWMEFDARTKSRCSLRPLIWFHFYTKQESDAARAQLQKGPTGECLLGTSGSEGSEEEELAEDVAEALFHGPQQGNPAARKTTGRDRLDVWLKQRVAANVVCVKLINQEDLMSQWGDDHEAPNIDINCVAFNGQRVILPAGMQLACE